MANGFTGARARRVSAVCVLCLVSVLMVPGTASAAPNPISISPQSVPNTGQATIQINGTGFAQGATVRLRRSAQPDIPGTNVSVSLVSMSAKFDVTAAAPGAWTVTVTNPDSSNGSCNNCLTVTAQAPTVTAAAPASRAQGTVSQPVTLTGTNFARGAVASVSGTGVTVNTTTFVSPTQLALVVSIDASAAPGARNITVTNTDGKAGSCSGCFTVNAAPGPTTTNPSAAPNTGPVTVTITGSGFQNGATVLLRKTGSSDINGTNVSVASSSSLSAQFNITGAKTGSWTVRVTNPDHGVGSCECFTVTAAGGLTVTGASPGMVGQGAQSKDVTVLGTAFAQSANVQISGSGVTINSKTWQSATAIKLNLSVSNTATPSARSIVVTNPGATADCSGCLTVTEAPIVTTVFPDGAARGSVSSVTMTGSGFTAPLTVAFSGSGVSANSVSVATAARMTMTVTVASGAGIGERSVTVTDSRGGTSTCDGCFMVIRFGDVPPSHFAFSQIETLAAHGITGGCATSPPRYCPNANVSRGQMAVFILRAMGHGAAGHLPAYRGIFADVPSSNPFARYIEHLYDHGITGGCATRPRRYCPNDSVTRGQMAVFLLRAIGHAASSHLGQYQGTFTDVPSSNPFARYIEHLYAHGVTGGCSTGPLRYCPSARVTRAQMAIFIVRTFGL